MLWLLPALVTAKMLNLTAFSKEMFWDEPQQGLYEVDVGLEGNNGHLMAFADLNSDKYTDIITASGDTFIINLFNTKTSTFD